MNNTKLLLLSSLFALPIIANTDDYDDEGKPAVIHEKTSAGAHKPTASSRSKKTKPARYHDPIWDEFDQIHEEFSRLSDQIDELMERAFTHEPMVVDLRTLKSDFNIEEKDNNLIVRISLPDIDPDAVHISIEHNVLKISGTKQETVEKENGVKAHTKTHSFEMIRTLPCPVDAEATTAEYQDGTLTITMPKKEKNKQIKVIKATPSKSAMAPEVIE